MDLLHEILQNQPDYSTIKENCFFKLPTAESVDVSVIIPVHGRTEFHKTITRHFRDAIRVSDRKISLTIVEHGNGQQHGALCEDWVNYIYIPQDGKPFNKALAHNIAAMYGPKSEYLLFHDVDIIIPPNYFIQVFKNLKDFDAMQTFSRRRLWQADEKLTGGIITAGNVFFDVVPFSSRHIKELESGASGGSMFVKRNLFYEIGGFDPELFTEYSIEDQMFFDKLKQCGKLGFCDDPEINLVHLWHKPSFNRTTKQYDWDVYDAFKKLNDEQRKAFYKQKSRYLIMHTSRKYKQFLELMDICKYELSDDNINQMCAMGEDVLGWIVEDIKKSEWPGWFQILEKITGCKVVPAHHNGYMHKVANDWVSWYMHIYKY